MLEIVVTAAPYCYGPTSKVLCLASELSQFSNITFVGAEPGLSLARLAKFDRVVSLRDRDDWSEEALDALTESDCLVSALDSRAIRVAWEHRKRSVFIDTLAWLRETPPPYAQLASAYIVQEFFAPTASTFLGHISNSHFVGPIFSKELDGLRKPGSNHCDGSILVNFGGLTSPAMLPNADVEYVSWITDILRRIDVDHIRLIICIPVHLRHLSAEIQRRLPDSHVVSASLDEFHHHLTKSVALISTPGLETILEAMYLMVPIIFLPPHNGTQSLQLQQYQTLGVGQIVARRHGEHVKNVGDIDLHRLTRKTQLANHRAALDDADTDQIAAALQ